MSDDRLTAIQIRARLTSRDNVYSPDGSPQNDAWGEVFAALSNDGLNHLIAWTYAQDDYDSTEPLSPEEFAESFERTYRQAWETPAAFAKHVAEDESETTDPEESKGRAWFLENYGEFIDWDASAESDKITDSYMLIMFDAKNSREVHVFEMDA